MKHILCIVFIFFLGFLLFPATVDANAAPIEMVADEEYRAPAFLATIDADTPLQVESEELLFDLRESAYYAKIEARYILVNPTNKKVKQRVIFPYVSTEEYYASYSGAATDFVSNIDFLPPNDVTDVAIKLDTTEVDCKIFERNGDSELPIFQCCNETLSFNVSEPWMNRDNSEPVRLACFDLEIAPASTHQMNATYWAGASLDRSTTSKYKNVFSYLLSPAKHWASFGTLVINVFPNKKQPYMVNSTIPFTAEETGTYTTELDALPDKDLRFGMYHLPKEDGKVWSEYDYHMAQIYFIIAGIVVTIIALVFLAIKRRRRKT